MDPKALLYLATVVELGSLSRAAERLNVTQPTLTRTVKLIEDRVGAPVLRRERYGVVPTQLGELLAERGRVISSEMDVTQEMVKLWHAGLTSELNLAMSPIPSEILTPGFLALSLNGDWPYSLNLSVGSSDSLLGMLGRGDVDLVVARRRLRAEEEGFDQIPLYDDEEIAVAGRHAPLAVLGRAPMPEEIAQANWISLESDRSGQDADLGGLTKHAGRRITAQARLSGNLRSIAVALEQTDACMVLPRRIWNQLPDREGCRVLPLGPIRKVEMSIWRLRSQADRPEVAHCIEQLRRFSNSQTPLSQQPANALA